MCIHPYTVYTKVYKYIMYFIYISIYNIRIRNFLRIPSDKFLSAKSWFLKELTNVLRCCPLIPAFRNKTQMQGEDVKKRSMTFSTVALKNASSGMSCYKLLENLCLRWLQNCCFFQRSLVSCCDASEKHYLQHTQYDPSGKNASPHGTIPATKKAT